MCLCYMILLINKRNTTKICCHGVVDVWNANDTSLCSLSCVCVYATKSKNTMKKRRVCLCQLCGLFLVCAQSSTTLSHMLKKKKRRKRNRGVKKKIKTIEKMIHAPKHQEQRDACERSLNCSSLH